MLTSLALLFLVGLGLAAVFERLKLPRILGMLLAGVLLGTCAVNVLDAPLLGAVLSAVSPAVVVPRMLHLMETGYGTKQGVPQLIMAGASCDDIFVIVLFITFLGMARGGQAQWLDFVNIPVSMLLGVALSLAGTPLNRREHLFCVLAYLPKATVQAAIGSMPLAMGLPCGSMVLSVAVLGILLTAPLGAICMDKSYRRLLAQA